MLDHVASLSGESLISLVDSNYVPSLYPGSGVTSAHTRSRGLLHLRPDISDIRRGYDALT
jgi:hypothetical protein